METAVSFLQEMNDIPEKRRKTTRKKYRCVICEKKVQTRIGNEDR
jgi:hypothetical protein